MGDEPVMATNDDASECKRGAVQLGYWQDSYINSFVRHMDRRAPEINRGYYARVKGMERFIQKFLCKAGSNAQIINLGAGYDTLYWRLKEDGTYITNYVEIDFPSVSSNKCHMIKKNRDLLDIVHDQDGEIKFSSTDLHGKNYHCIGVDMRNLQSLEAKLQQAEVNFNAPTLFLAECVLVYIETESVDRLLKWISTKFNSVLFVNYEMCNINDTFGDVMVGNLKARGCNLAGISACKSLETQKARFETNGFQGAKAWDMVEIYRSFPASERQRVEKIEFLDEQELLVQLFQHYCICVGWLGNEFGTLNFDD